MGSKTFSSSDSEEDSEQDEVENPEEVLPFWISHPVRFNLLIFAMVVFWGIVTFKHHRGVDWVTAWYLVVQIITTIGYGDVPEGLRFRWWLILYVLVLTVLAANVMNELFSSLVWASEENVRRHIGEVQRRLSDGQLANDNALKKRYGQFNKIAASVLIYLFFVATWAVFFTLYEYCTCGYGGGQDLVLGCMEGQKCKDTGGYTTEFADALYMAVVTFSTVGFGDIAPKSELGRALGSLWMILGVLAFANMVKSIAEVIDQYKKSVKESLQRRQTRKIWSGMNKDEHGAVSKDAFLIFMIRRKNLVSKATLDELGQIFNIVDSDGDEKLTVDEVSASLDKIGA